MNLNDVDIILYNANRDCAHCVIMQLSLEMAHGRRVTFDYAIIDVRHPARA